MPPTSPTSIPAALVRVEVRKELLRRIRATLPDDTSVAVQYRYWPNSGARQIIAGDDVEGEITAHQMRAGRHERIDGFDLKIVCAVGPNAVELDTSDPLDPGGFASVDAACLALVQVVDDVLADPDGARMPEISGALVLSITSLEGPNGTETNEGPGAAAIVTVRVESRHR